MLKVACITETSASKIEIGSFRFSDGAIQVMIQSPWQISSVPLYEIYCELRSSDAIMELLMATNALRSAGAKRISLVCPFLPYARQDRVCDSGEALALKVMCDLINLQGYEKVQVWDVHSDVATFGLNSCENITARVFVGQIISKRLINKTNTILVAPDAGARKRVSECAKIHDMPMISADKTRDVKTGAITGTIVHSADVGDKDFLIVDDICDGGRTFIELAKELRKLTSGKVLLYVTHGIFSKGLEPFDSLIDTIYCAAPWKTEEELRVIPPQNYITAPTALVKV